MSSSSSTPSLTPSRSPTPSLPIQPDHFYGADDGRPIFPSYGKPWLDPSDDPLAQRGIPVFKPTMEEFADFEGYMNQVECWGTRSGIVKVIPPKEWVDALPAYKDQLLAVKIKSPIEQHMLGRGGLFRQENLEKRRIMSVREWVELCGKDDLRAPGVNEVGLHARSAHPTRTKTKREKRPRTDKAETAEPEADADEAHAVKQEPDDEDQDMEVVDESGHQAGAGSSHDSTSLPGTPPALDHVPSPNPTTSNDAPPEEDDKSRGKSKRPISSREARGASIADRAARDVSFIDTFDLRSDWLPSETRPSDYTPEFCQKLERQYWRNCGLGRPPWYGADMQGSLYTDDTKTWNVAHLESALSRLLPTSSKGVPGVNTPYLYFGMWRATFAWHVEDMDLFSINYIHFGAPKFWYAVPQARAAAMEQTMRGYFPKDTSQCPQFLRHKSFLASPTLLAQSSCRPNTLVQHAGEFVITFPRGYHAGFNLGINCAESVNFALESWLDLGRKAKACQCVSDSVRIDVDQLLADREAERLDPSTQPPRSSSRIGAHKSRPSRKRKSDGDSALVAKKTKSSEPAKGPLPKITLTLKLGPKPPPEQPFPCCLCISMNEEGLLRVSDPPIGLKTPPMDESARPKVWRAHELCANVVPETWVDEMEVGDVLADGTRAKERVVFGVDAIVRDRWNLKCTACTKSRYKAHGAPVQCTKGKCPKAFHVSCAQNGAENNIIFQILREVEKEVVLLDPITSDSVSTSQAAPEHPPATGTDTGRPQQPDSGCLSTDPSGPRILKTIRKAEVQILCSQHNPAIAAAKKASKQDKIRDNLLALPAMTRIKIRVSAGVFEVSLLRVIESTGSVEVLWDKGIKKEFKWGSVVFGNLEGQTIFQKPSEPAPEPSYAPIQGQSYPTYPALTHYSHYATPRTVPPAYASTGWQSYAHPQPQPQTASGYTPENYYRVPYPPYNAHYPTANYSWSQPHTSPCYPPVASGPPSSTSTSGVDTPNGAVNPGSSSGPSPPPSNASINTTPSLPLLQPSQIESILKVNPDLRYLIQATMEKQQVSKS